MTQIKVLKKGKLIKIEELKNEYSYIISDLDNTLISSNLVFDKPLLKIIKKIRHEFKIPFSIITGASKFKLFEVIKTLYLNDFKKNEFLGYETGAVLSFPKTKKEIIIGGFNEEQIKEIKFCLDGKNFSKNVMKKIKENFKKFPDFYEKKAKEIGFKTEKFFEIVVANYPKEKMISYNQHCFANSKIPTFQPCFEISYQILLKTITELKNEKKLCFDLVIKKVTDGLEITSPETNKANAINKFLKIEKIGYENLLFLGDSSNDPVKELLLKGSTVVYVGNEFELKNLNIPKKFKGTLITNLNTGPIGTRQVLEKIYLKKK